MGKKRITTDSGVVGGLKTAGRPTGGKKKIAAGILHIEATYNNTKLTLTDPAGNVVLHASSGSLGFKGAKKGTPFAAGKVAETLAEQALNNFGLQEVEIVVRGVGAGRESAVRAFAGKGVNITAIKDATPMPFNGPRPPRARRV